MPYPDTHKQGNANRFAIAQDYAISESEPQCRSGNRNKWNTHSSKLTPRPNIRKCKFPTPEESPIHKANIVT